MSENIEIEIKFLNIDKDALVRKLVSLGAEDLAEDLARETLFRDKKGEWKKQNDRFVRVRTIRRKTFVTYKNHKQASIDGTEEIEFEVSDRQKAEDFLDRVGLMAFREQEKKRHTFKLDNVVVDIDTWPNVPTYVELEGLNETDLRAVAMKLGFDWSKAVFLNARKVIESYGVSVSDFKFFTFKKIE